MIGALGQAVGVHVRYGAAAVELGEQLPQPGIAQMETGDV